MFPRVTAAVLTFPFMRMSESRASKTLADRNTACRLNTLLSETSIWSACCISSWLCVMRGKTFLKNNSVLRCSLLNLASPFTQPFIFTITPKHVHFFQTVTNSLFLSLCRGKSSAPFRRVILWDQPLDHKLLPLTRLLCLSASRFLCQWISIYFNSVQFNSVDFS